MTINKNLVRTRMHLASFHPETMQLKSIISQLLLYCKKREAKRDKFLLFRGFLVFFYLQASSQRDSQLVVEDNGLEKIRWSGSFTLLFLRLTEQSLSQAVVLQFVCKFVAEFCQKQKNKMRVNKNLKKPSTPWYCFREYYANLLIHMTVKVYW